MALILAIQKRMNSGLIAENPIKAQIAAISAGVVGDVPLLDLCYTEDSAAQADMNFVMNHRAEFVEMQGTGEGRAFTRLELDKLMAYGQAGIRGLMREQRRALQNRGDLLVPLPRLVVATGNAHKLKELRAIFGGVCELTTMREAGFTGEIEEDGDTFAKNAAIKAEAVARATGLPALADDSGLSVNALDGAPGVLSARYAGGHGEDGANNSLLLKNMEGATDRRCKFVCAMALALPGEETRSVSGECEGILLAEKRGESGFGYDPLFMYENGKTFAEMSETQKNRVSHRAVAARKMLEVLREVL